MARALFTLSFAALVASSFAQLPSDFESKVDTVCKEWNTKSGPGGVVGVAVDGKLVFAKGYGLANVESGTPNTADTVMDVGSVSKQFTAVCMLLLQEEGKLDLDDDITKYVPEIPTFGKTVTIRQLLEHVSGLRDYLTLMAVSGWNLQDRRTFEDAMDVMTLQQGLNSEPGARFNYCNTGYMLCAVIVERVSGSTLARYAKDNVFTPLGMDKSSFVTGGSAILPDRALSYQKGLLGQTQNATSGMEIYGDGGVHTTVADLVKWHENFVDNKLGKKRKELVAEMLEVGVTNDKKPTKYALGLFVDDLDGVPRVQHGGNWLGFNAMTQRYPTKHVSVFALGNDGTNLSSPYADQIARLVLNLPAPAENAEIKLAAEKLKPFEGTYAFPDGRVLTVSRNAEQLSAQVTGQQALPIFASSDTKFFYKAVKATLDFKKDDSGSVVGVTLRQGPAVIEMKRGEPFKPSPEDLKGWVGTYVCHEMPMTIDVTVDGDRLKGVDQDGDPFPLSLTSKDSASVPGMSIKAVRDSGGTIRYVTLDVGRAVGMRLIRKS
ncbi:MAG: serine hydrolase [Armatimonadetes bacterium]|nr:serine hydrolase [Armatimonadota bacterium]